MTEYYVLFFLLALCSPAQAQTTFALGTPPPGATNVPRATQILLEFKGVLDPTSVIELFQGAQPVLGVTTFQAGVPPTVLIFTPAQPLDFNTVYRVSAARIRDAQGSPVVGFPALYTFTTERAPDVRLVSSVPAANATNVALNTVIQLMFDGAIDPASRFTVRGARQNVRGVISFSPDNRILTFTPTVPLDPATDYMVDFSSLRTALGGMLLGPFTFTFRTTGGAQVVAASVPQTAQAGAGERLNLSYQLRNLSNLTVRITNSRLDYFLPNGALLASVAQPMNLTIAPNAAATSSAEVVVVDTMVAAARAAGTDTLLAVRVFQGVDANGNPVRSLTDTALFAGFAGDPTVFGQGIVAITRIRLLSSLSGRVAVREIRLTAPTEDQLVVRNAPLRARALLQATGNGVVIGRWLVDGKPVESFSVSVVAGQPVEVSSLRNLPTLELGEHRIQLEILSPNALRSREARMVVSGFAQNGQPRLLTPRNGALIAACDAASLVFRWQVVPGASGYEVGFASSLADLGLKDDGTPLPERLQTTAFQPKRLLVYRRVSNAGTTSVHLTEDEYRRITKNGATTVFWTVRPLFPPNNQPVPDQTAFPGSLQVGGAEQCFEGAESATTDPNAKKLLPRLRLQFDTQFMGTDQNFNLDSIGLAAVLDGGFQTGETATSLNATAALPIGGGGFHMRRMLSNFQYQQDGFNLAVGDVGVQTSNFSASGLPTRALQTQFTAGGLRFGYTKSFSSQTALSSNLGSAVDTQMGTVETSGFTQGKGLRLILNESVQQNSFTDATSSALLSGVRSQLWNLVGQHPVGSKMSLRGEMARSRSRVPTLAGGEMEFSGNARRMDADVQLPRGWRATAGYRQVEAAYLSPAAQTLASNLRGWEMTAGGPLTHHATLNLNTSRQSNDGSDLMPHSNNRNVGLQLNVQIPRFIPLQLSLQQTDGRSDPLTAGTSPAKTRDRQVVLSTFTRLGSVDTSLSYTIAKFTDFFDMTDPAADTPNDSKTNFVTIGLGWQGRNLSLRGDWSNNRVGRSARDPLTLLLLQGNDKQDNLRLQGEYGLRRNLSVSTIWSRSTQRDVLGLSSGRVTDYATRLNWSLSGGGQGRFVLALEWRRTTIVSGASSRSDSMFAIVLNDARLLNLR